MVRGCLSSGVVVNPAARYSEVASLTTKFCFVMTAIDLVGHGLHVSFRSRGSHSIWHCVCRSSWIVLVLGMYSMFKFIPLPGLGIGMHLSIFNIVISDLITCFSFGCFWVCEGCRVCVFCSYSV